MKTCSKCKVVQQPSEFYKDSGRVDGLYPRCKSCIKAYRKKNKAKFTARESQYRLDNPEKLKEARAKYYQGNKERLGELNRKSKLDNVARNTARAREYYQENKQRLNSRSRENHRVNKERYLEKSRQWKRENKGTVNFHCANRHAAKLLRTPAWLTKEDHIAILEKYELSQSITSTTGIKHHVDHIIPLQGKLVSGLHVPTNLQVITASENLRKNNSYNPLEGCPWPAKP